jgi:hypothetical protein
MKLLYYSIISTTTMHISIQYIVRAKNIQYSVPLYGKLISPDLLFVEAMI